MLSKALIAMSGGVDSSVAAFLTIEQGYDCAGAMMKLYSGPEPDANNRKSCCSLADAEDARSVAFRLGIPFYVFNFVEEFSEKVIDRFAGAYLSGVTPNPCIDCNRFLKFEKFLRRANEIGRDMIVTGHYAQIEYDEMRNRYLLKKGVDASKDQSYVLYAMTQEQLAHTLLPLGRLVKSQVREIALERGFLNAKKHESQDICFVPDGDYAAFIEQYTGIKAEKGLFIDAAGHNLGEHKGIFHYTVGQRRGLGISAPAPLYVCGINPDTNTVVLGDDAELYSKTLTAKDINLILYEKLEGPMKVTAKIRYRHEEQPATVTQADSDTLHIEFDTAQRAITKGQAVVFYDGDYVVGGGTII